MESIEIIEKLFTGKKIKHRGAHFNVESARLYTLPPSPPPIYVATSGPVMAMRTGKFTDVRTINDVFGSYARGEVHAGAVKSGTAQVLTKGTVSLALAGSGEGIDLGIDVGAFTIEPR